MKDVTGVACPHPFPLLGLPLHVGVLVPPSCRARRPHLLIEIQAALLDDLGTAWVQLLIDHHGGDVGPPVVEITPPPLFDAFGGGT